MGLKLSQIRRALASVFQKKQRNSFQYGKDKPLDKDLKPFDIGGKQTILELSESELKVRGTIDADAISVNGASVQTGDEVGAVTAINNAVADRLVTVGATTTELEGEAGLTFSSGTGLLTIEADEALHSQLRLTHAGTDYFHINAGLNGATTIATHDAVGTAGNMELESDGTMTLDANDDFTLDCEGVVILDSSNNQIHLDNGGTRFGTLNMATGSHLKLIATDNYGLSLVTGGTGDITLDSNGDIILDSADGNFIAKKAGTEFSVANSAYAGMILGYRMIGEDAVHSSYTLTTSMVVPDSDMTVRFIAPPSGAVEVMVQVLFDGTSNRSCTFGLSDNATYNSIGNSYEQMTCMVDETDLYTHQHYWTITGLTAGDTYNYWFGASANGGTISWGGTGAGRFPDFIMKVTALPEATANFAVYD